MKKMTRALLFTCLAGLAGHAAAGTISVTPSPVTGSTAGGATQPTPTFIRYEAAAAGETTNSVQVRLTYDTSRIDVTTANVAPGTCSNNDGTGTIILTAIDLGGGNLATGNMCQLTITVTAGAAVTLPLDLQFNAGLGDGSFDGAGNATAVQATLTDGSVVISAGTFNYSVAPTTLTFSGAVGAASPAQNAVITAAAGNTGAVTFTGCAITGANAGDFAINPAVTFPLNIAAGATSNIPVVFTAGALGARTASLSCTSSNGAVVGTGFPVTLNGTGVANTLTATPALTFPATLEGSTAPSQNVVATAGAGNTGNVTINSCAITGANAADFAQTPATTNVPVAPGASVNVPVTFTPTVGGGAARTATLTCTLTNGPANFVTTLSGTATAVLPVITSNPATGTTITALGSAGTPLTRSVIFSNSGNGPGTVTCTVTGTGFTVNPVTPITVAAGGTGSVNVTGSSATPATLTGTLTCTPSVGTAFTFPLSFVFGAPAVAQIPAIGNVGLFALITLFGGLGLVAFRKRG